MTTCHVDLKAGPRRYGDLIPLWRSVMRYVLVPLVLLAVMHKPAPAHGLAEAGELEHARANARAGGPLSDRDKELLDRWGCLSGTRSSFCIERERYYRWDRPRHREKRHYRNR